MTDSSAIKFIIKQYFKSNGTVKSSSNDGESVSKEYFTNVCETLNGNISLNFKQGIKIVENTEKKYNNEYTEKQQHNAFDMDKDTNLKLSILLEILKGQMGNSSEFESYENQVKHEMIPKYEYLENNLFGEVWPDSIFTK